MKQVMIIVILVPLLFLHGTGWEQQKGVVLTGKVISFDERAALEGVTIQVKGTRNVSGTLYDGMYAIEIRPTDTILVFSYDGYETTEVIIKADRREYNVMLKSKAAWSSGREGTSCMINNILARF